MESGGLDKALKQMSSYDKDMSSKFQQVSTAILAGMTMIMVLTILTIGIVTSGYTANFHIASKYETASCILTAASTVSIGCVSNYYVATWSTSTGRTVLQSPFAANRNKAYVDSQLNNYPLNVAIECVCRTDVNIIYPAVERETPCDVYGQCFLNTQALDFMKGQQYLFNIGITLIVMGVVGLLILVILFAVVCFHRRRSKYAHIQDGVV